MMPRSGQRANPVATHRLEKVRHVDGRSFKEAAFSPRPKRTALMALYITGGQHKPLGLKAREEWVTYEKGIILRVDPESGSVERCVEYITPADYCPEDSSITFEGGVLQGDLLYTCTRTEALVYRIPKFTLLNRVSLPCFNDVHHVRPSKDGGLLVTSTGLDMVVETTLDGEVLRDWGVLGESPWVRFSRDIDYRLVPTTKPHRSHPNYTFFLEDELWVTRCLQKDAVSLTNPGRQIEVGVEVCHDGEIYGDNLYFTTVNGNVVIVNAKTLETERVIDLNAIDNPENSNLGWCRGLAVMSESRMWVGFTRFRETRFKENIRWVKRIIKGEEKVTHIALYDVSAGKCITEIDLEPFGMHVIFGIFPTDIG
jgi:hypothetical protein